mmetsp:Transcript_10886/g.11020  ORF Transcript_10886/g.11020 Transcript_10886/m.11020 type:complete len:159 (-) Transcript_10886:40-516(-)
MVRPNVFIAMALAPELFDFNKAQVVLNTFSKALTVQGVSQPEYLGVALLDSLDDLYEEIAPGKVNKRRYLWLTYYLVKAKLNFKLFSEADHGFSQKQAFTLMEHVTPLLKLLNEPTNECLGLADYYSADKLETVKACAMSHACLLQSIHEIYLEGAPQ